MRTQTNTRTPQTERRASSKKKSKAQSGNGAAVEAATEGATGPSYDDIAARAYEIWNAQGRPEGRENEHWQQAEEELMSGMRSSGSAG